MALAKVLAAINTLLFTALIFYLIFTPYALLAKLLGWDLLDEKLQTGESYWKERDEDPDPQRCQRLF